LFLVSQTLSPIQSGTFQIEPATAKLSLVGNRMVSAAKVQVFFGSVRQHLGFPSTAKRFFCKINFAAVAADT